MGPLSNGLGGVTRIANGVTYFSVYKQVADPSTQNIASAAIRSQSTLLAVQDASGKLILVNAMPGQFGTLAPNFLTCPGLFRVDVNLVKRILIAEGKELLLRADAVNSTNTPEFANPNTDINSPNFGRIAVTLPGTNRVIVLGARFNFDSSDPEHLLRIFHEHTRFFVAPPSCRKHWAIPRLQRISRGICGYFR